MASPPSSNESVWPHLIVGFVAVVAVAAYAGAPPGTAAWLGLVGAVVGYVLHVWRRPQAECWWPWWLWGCRGRSTTRGKFYRFKRPCPLHPSTSYYVRPLARVFGWGGPPERKDG